jgi:hypothetical protein
LGPFRCRDFGLSAALEGHFAGGVDVGVGNRRLELDDICGKRCRSLFLVLGVVFQLRAKLGKQLGGDFCASRKIAKLRMLRFRAEGVFRSSRVGGAGFARESDDDFGCGCGILGAVSPGVSGAFASDVDGLEHQRWIVRAVEALGTLLADANAPAGLARRSSSCG